MVWYLLMLVSIGITIWAQVKVQGNFSKWSQVRASSGLTGAEVARHILDRNGLSNVTIERIPGKLSDHYDPSARRIRLSEMVYDSNSIAAISVASHECGHALQHQESYGALVLRHRLVPVLQFTSGAAPWLLLAGIFFRATGLLFIGIVFFAVAVVFHLVTLPVEFNASARAKRILASEGFIRGAEDRGVDKVLDAAALTYIAGALVALMQLFYYIAIFLGQRNRD
ncbi:zinc metallopeptidase [Risungbinella massiliensis]|uniref:zinc metallopeptidase n=1 Tax=Risungbinella massiliensis TaxID=1329796 RepID=UPI0005CB9020|nr:zinc metallopeptidase [Risungbinella massiliensis]